ncbi:hypothetical protein ACQ86N_11730 [Puia sp. P3]|uniref:hypothetical protein n=1 Tax=Puia sp. P3 TaxID=3423952 RepID=UPI003D67B4D7
MKTIKLYRPVGLRELELIQHSGWKGFPPRLEWQPIFYPVLNIVGEIRVVSAFFGEGFVMPEDTEMKNDLIKFRL